VQWLLLSDSNKDTKEITLKIIGMHCAACAQNIEKSPRALADVKGVALNESEVNEKNFSTFLFYFSV